MSQVKIDSLKDRWKTYFFWFLSINLAFFLTYPLCNWITSQRNDTVGLYLDFELSIPFIPGFIWAYFSMNLLFLAPPFILNVTQLQTLGKRLLVGTLISTLAFLVIPTHLGFTRTIPQDIFYQPIFSKLFELDQPHNLAPSLHVVYSSVTIFLYMNLTKGTLWKIVLFIWLILIIASTMLVHQHHLADILMGLLISTAIHFGVKK